MGAGQGANPGMQLCQTGSQPGTRHQSSLVGEWLFLVAVPGTSHGQWPACLALLGAFQQGRASLTPAAFSSWAAAVEPLSLLPLCLGPVSSSPRDQCLWPAFYKPLGCSSGSLQPALLVPSLQLQLASASSLLPGSLDGLSRTMGWREVDFHQKGHLRGGLGMSPGDWWSTSGMPLAEDEGQAEVVQK